MKQSCIALEIWHSWLGHYSDDVADNLPHAEHPYAPFPGNALKWDSFVYDDGTT